MIAGFVMVFFLILGCMLEERAEKNSKAYRD